MKKLLSPVSFSEISQTTIKQASFIVNQLNANLELLHCYPIQEYNRAFHFDNPDYESGIKQKLIDFTKSCISEVDEQKINFIAFPGAVSEVISRISQEYDLLVLSRKIGFQSQKNHWLSDKLFYIISKSLTQVLILTPNRNTFTFKNVKEIWHINRGANEVELINLTLPKLNIQTDNIKSKSLQQESFSSAFWKNIVNYSKTLDKSILDQISVSFNDENIDLLILVNHRKGLFENFLQQDAFQILSQFDIPILILQSTPIEG